MTIAPTFMSSVHGAMHIDKGWPREDAGGKLETENYSIFVTADGHGSNECIRSAQGAQFAVDIAIEKLSSFAETIDEKLVLELFNKRKSEERVRKLIISLFNAWYDKVYQDVTENPITEEEYNEAGKVSAHYRLNNHLEHAYGTTLLAGLMTKDYLLLLHQGDGRTIVFDQNGEATEPVPWDDRCLDNMTTSLSDKDAIESCRYLVIPVKESHPIAVFLCSDGVEDSFGYAAERHNFCREILKKFCEQGIEETEKELDDILSDLSQTGSRDDVTVSGYVFVDEVKPFLSRFEDESTLISFQTRLNRVNDKLKSMSRKMEYLRSRYKQALEDEKNAQNSYEQAKSEVKMLVDKINMYFMNNISFDNNPLKEEESLNQTISAKETAKQEFLEYNERYTSFVEEKERLEQEIEALSKKYKQEEVVEVVDEPIENADDTLELSEKDETELSKENIVEDVKEAVEESEGTTEETQDSEKQDTVESENEMTNENSVEEDKNSEESTLEVIGTENNDTIIEEKTVVEDAENKNETALTDDTNENSEIEIEESKVEEESEESDLDDSSEEKNTKNPSDSTLEKRGFWFFRK